MCFWDIYEYVATRLKPVINLVDNYELKLQFLLLWCLSRRSKSKTVIKSKLHTRKNRSLSTLIVFLAMCVESQLLMDVTPFKHPLAGPMLIAKKKAIDRFQQCIKYNLFDHDFFIIHFRHKSGTLIFKMAVCRCYVFLKIQ